MCSCSDSPPLHVLGVVLLFPGVGGGSELLPASSRQRCVGNLLIESRPCCTNVGPAVPAGRAWTWERRGASTGGSPAGARTAAAAASASTGGSATAARTVAAAAFASTGGIAAPARSAAAAACASTDGSAAGARIAAVAASASTGGAAAIARSAVAVPFVSTGGSVNSARSAAALASASTDGSAASARSAAVAVSASTGGCAAGARSAAVQASCVASASTGGSAASTSVASRKVPGPPPPHSLHLLRRRPCSQMLRQSSMGERTQMSRSPRCKHAWLVGREVVSASVSIQEYESWLNASEYRLGCRFLDRCGVW